MHQQRACQDNTLSYRLVGWLVGLCAQPTNYAERMDLAARHNTMWNYIFSMYRLRRGDYEQIAHAQGFVCAICSSPPAEDEWLAVDHNHVTDTVRGLLCVRCNTGIAVFGEDQDIMRAAIDYLALHDREDIFL